jgi:hypothetical protein
VPCGGEGPKIPQTSIFLYPRKAGHTSVHNVQPCSRGPCHDLNPLCLREEETLTIIMPCRRFGKIPDLPLALSWV